MKALPRREFLGILGVGGMELALARPGQGAQPAAAADEPPVDEEPGVFTSGRDDGRFVETAGYLQAQMKQLHPQLAFDPAMKAEAFSAWREAVRAKLRELLCFPENLSTQPEPKRIWTRQRKGYQLQRWEAYPEPFCIVPYLVLVPDGVSQQSPAPAVMCFPGSAWSKESLAGEPELAGRKPPSPVHWATNRQALFYAQRGFVAVAVENPATNETGSPLRNRTETCNFALWLGRNYLGISVFQKACVLQWLSRLPWVDATRIAASGHSLGSNPADILGILYPDLVKAVVHNDFVYNSQERSIAMNAYAAPLWHTVPGMLRWFDHDDLQAALAPCPLLFTEGGRKRSIEKIRQAYRLLGAENQLEVSYYAKYATSEQRPLDDADIPEGVSMEEYFRYANVDPAQHQFRPERAVPWLADIMGVEPR